MNNVEGIKEAITNYFEGVKKGDIDTIRKAFLDDQIHMKGIMTLEGSKEYKVWANQEMLDALGANASDSLVGEVLKIDVYADNAAFALFNFNNIYTDAFQLLKVKDQWKIINKTFVER